MSAALIPALCPICGNTVAAPFFDGGMQTLATLGWPKSTGDARSMARYPLHFVQCPKCSHVWNRSFSYEAVPYKDNPNRMFNMGGIWTGHLAATRSALLRHLPAMPTVVEIGCGEGHFLRGLSRACGGGRYIGFDPNSSADNGGDIEFCARLFEPLQDMPAYRPDAVIIRHVLEHLNEPGALLEQLAWGTASQGKSCLLFAEMPCIDRVFETGRLADFYFEHTAQFTTDSFRALMQRAGQVIDLAHGYDGEVVYAMVKLGIPAAMQARAAASRAFAERSEVSKATIRAQLDELWRSGKRVAIWGGTGKAAAFMHQFGADSKRFPLVVDSDPEKAGTFVPGTGQEILFRDALKARPVDVVIVPTQWRARDIVAEMAREGISVPRVLIEHGGRLVDFASGEHPYH